jgi:hypothetical protein
MDQTQTSAGETAPYQAAAGFRFPPLSICISHEEQRRLHGWCDIAPDVYGDVADPALVSRLPVVLLAETIRQSRPGWGQVHIVHRINQRRPIRLGERLQMSGSIEAVEKHARGEVLKSVWRYLDTDGEIPFEVIPDALMIDPAFESERPPKKTRHQRAAHNYRVLLTKKCTPAATLGYCEGTDNPIHLDPKYAQDFGFRAPIIAGTQTMNYLLEPLYRGQTPGELALCIRFRRPVFWDDTLTIEGLEEGHQLGLLRAVNAAGNCVADCEIKRSLGTL